jgi:hypothetical protein
VTRAVEHAVAGAFARIAERIVDRATRDAFVGAATDVAE